MQYATAKVGGDDKTLRRSVRYERQPRETETDAIEASWGRGRGERKRKTSRDGDRDGHRDRDRATQIDKGRQTNNERDRDREREREREKVGGDDTTLSRSVHYKRPKKHHVPSNTLNLTTVWYSTQAPRRPLRRGSKGMLSVLFTFFLKKKKR